MAEDKRKADLPPYISYRTFKNWLAGRRAGIPDQIDRSILGNMSGVVQSQLLSTLRFLRLISADSRVSDQLQKLVHAEGAGRQVILSEILKTSYGFLFDGTLPLLSATPAQFTDAFTKQGVTGDTVRKSISFFLLAAKDAGLSVSPFLKSQRASRGPTQRKHQSRSATGSERPGQTPPINGRANDIPEAKKTPYELLIEILDPGKMEKEEQEAVWTLIRYLKRRESPVL